MNRLVVVALNTIFALRLNKTRRTVGRTDSRLDGWSGVTKDWSGKSDCVASEPFPFYLGRFLTGPLWISRQLASPKVDLFNIFPYASYTFIYLQIYVHIPQITSLYLHIAPFTLKYPIWWKRGPTWDTKMAITRTPGCLQGSDTGTNLPTMSPKALARPKGPSFNKKKDFWIICDHIWNIYDPHIRILSYGIKSTLFVLWEHHPI